MKAILEQHQLYHAQTGSPQPPFSEIIFLVLHSIDLVQKALGIFVPIGVIFGFFLLTSPLCYT